MRWLKRTNRKEFSSLIIEVKSAKPANRLIIEGLILGYDLKLVERYDTGCRNMGISAQYAQTRRNVVTVEAITEQTRA